MRFALPYRLSVLAQLHVAMGRVMELLGMEPRAPQGAAGEGGELAAAGAGLEQLLKVGAWCGVMDCIPVSSWMSTHWWCGSPYQCSAVCFRLVEVWCVGYVALLAVFGDAPGALWGGLGKNLLGQSALWHMPTGQW